MKTELTRRIGLIAALGVAGLAFAYLQTPTSASPAPAQAPPPISATTTTPPASSAPIPAPEQPRAGVVDIRNIAPNEEIAILWEEAGCFFRQRLDIRVRGSNPDIATVSDLKLGDGIEVGRVEASLDPSTVEQSVEVVFDANHRAGFEEWMEKLRARSGRGCTTAVTLHLLKATTVGEEVTELREYLLDDWCSKKCGWVGDMRKAIDAARTAANAVPQAGS